MDCKQLILKLFEKQMLKFGDFTLKSGQKSYFYADVRTAISFPLLFKEICKHYYAKISGEHYDFICGVPYAALTFVSGIAYAHEIPMLLKRKEVKGYGTKKILEGSYKNGQSCFLIEDVVTSGKSLFETIQLLEEHGLKIAGICALIDRCQGGIQNLQECGYKVQSVMNLYEILAVLGEANYITEIDKQKTLALL